MKSTKNMYVGQSTQSHWTGEGIKRSRGVRWLGWMFACVLVVLGMWGCGVAAPEQSQDALSSCVDEETQASPFFGQSVTKEGKLGAAPEGDYYIVATHMKVRTSSQEAMGEFQRVMGKIQGAFPTQEGLLAASLYFSQKCGYAKTLTAWKSYDAMMKFVISETHADAMVNAHKVASHFRTTHWKGDTTSWPLDWKAASEKLVTISIKVYE